VAHCGRWFPPDQRPFFVDASAGANNRAHPVSGETSPEHELMASAWLGNVTTEQVYYGQDISECCQARWMTKPTILPRRTASPSEIFTDRWHFPAEPL
jgi:hypothetical protein